MSRPELIDRGSIVGGKFRIGEQLGRGAMGWVFEAEHVELGHSVAVKVIDPQGVDADALRRFRREGVALAKLESEHAVRVIDYGSLANGAPYLVMERLRGRDLSLHLREQKRLSVGEASEIICQACEALGEAHARGIVHRDLKPGNLFLAEKPNGKRTTKVLDFGVSLLRETNEDALTSNKMMLGTPFYMSPEQLLSSHDVNHQSDIWALGVILFQLTTGKRPFPAATIADLVNLLKSPAPSVLSQAPDAPEGFATVVARCLARTAAERFESAEELSAALDPFRDKEPLRVTYRDVADESAETVPKIATVPRRPPQDMTLSLSPAMPTEETSGAPDTPSAGATAQLPLHPLIRTQSLQESLSPSSSLAASPTPTQSPVVPASARSKRPTARLALLLILLPVAGAGAFLFQFRRSPPPLSVTSSAPIESESHALAPTSSEPPRVADAPPGPAHASAVASEPVPSDTRLQRPLRPKATTVSNKALGGASSSKTASTLPSSRF